MIRSHLGQPNPTTSFSRFATRIAPHADPWSLCKIMGWASLSVAMVYVHPQEDRVLAAFVPNEVKGSTKFCTTTDSGLNGESYARLQLAEG
jgi:hypothetical protein